MMKGKGDQVLRLKKFLHGLKQAPRTYYNRIDGYFIEQGFRKKAKVGIHYISRPKITLTLSFSVC